MTIRRSVLALCLGAACAFSGDAFAQVSRDSAVVALRAAANAGNVDAQLTLGGLLDRDPKVRDDEALGWYEKAARGGSRVAQQRYLEMRSRPAPTLAAPRGAFFIRLPKGALGEDGPPPDIPPGYHCHPLGNQQMWCHGGTDGRP
jgi:TPR repeat protein